MLPRGHPPIGWASAGAGPGSGGIPSGAVGIDHFGEQLDSLHAISVEIVSLRDLEKIYRRALASCLALTESEVGFIGLLSDPPDYLDLVAVDGLVVFDLAFYQQFRRMPVRSSVFGVTLVEERSYISNDVD